VNASARCLLLGRLGIPQWRLRRQSGQHGRTAGDPKQETGTRTRVAADRKPAVALYSARPDAKLMRQYKVIAEKPWRVAVAEDITVAQRTLLAAILSCCARRLDAPIEGSSGGLSLCFGVPCMDENSVALPALAEIMAHPGEMKPALWGQLRVLLEAAR